MFVPCEQSYPSVNNINDILINLVEISVCLYFVCTDYHFDNISTTECVPDHIRGREEPVHPCGNAASPILQISGRWHAAFIALVDEVTRVSITTLIIYKHFSYANYRKRVNIHLHVGLLPLSPSSNQVSLAEKSGEVKFQLFNFVVILP
jgi:hypothetical protein